MIAALYVEKDGAYYGLDDVDPWDEERDARQYAGPWSVVAHPPCNRWTVMSPLVESQHGYRVGDDGGTFAAALAAVRTFGGVLEHPALSLAWSTFGLPAPIRWGWARSFLDDGWTTEVSQVAYGHAAQKRTWLYYVGEEPPPAMDWREPAHTARVGDLWRGGNRGDDLRRMYRAESQATPAAFREALLALARSAATIGATRAQSRSRDALLSAIFSLGAD